MDAVTGETPPKKEKYFMPDGRPAMLTRDGRLMPAGRQKGATSKVVRTIREAVELACQPGQCHPRGLAGWLVERAQSRHAADRAIFAGMVGKALPLTVNQNVSGGIAIQLGWLQSRGIGAVAAQSAERVTEAIEHKANPALVNMTINQVGDTVVLRPVESPTGDAGGEHVPSPPRAVDRGL